MKSSVFPPTPAKARWGRFRLDAEKEKSCRQD